MKQVTGGNSHMEYLGRTKLTSRGFRMPCGFGEQFECLLYQNVCRNGKRMSISEEMASMEPDRWLMLGSKETKAQLI